MLNRLPVVIVPGPRGSGTYHSSPPAVPGLCPVYRQGLAFGSISGGIFLLLNFAFWWMYGQQFLHETFLYHGSRKDPRHSFSIYYYPVYLDFMAWPATATHATSGFPGALDATATIRPGARGDAAATGAVAATVARHSGRDQFAVLPQMALVLAPGSNGSPPPTNVLAAANSCFCGVQEGINCTSIPVWYYSLLPIALGSACLGLCQSS